MLEFSRGSLPEIVRNVFIDRGGAPAQFLIERVTLEWPGGLAGLRGPSLLFYLLALPCAGLLARELAGRVEALAVPLLLALAPLAIATATFARMYALFLLLVVVTSLVAIRAGHTRSRAWWAAAGALAAGLAYVHPIAPLYAVPAFASGLAVREGLAARRAPRGRGRPAGGRDRRPPLRVCAGRAASALQRRRGRQAVDDRRTDGRRRGVARAVAGRNARACDVLPARPRRRRPALARTPTGRRPPLHLGHAADRLLHDRPGRDPVLGRYALPALPAFLVLVGCRLIGNRVPVVLALIAVALVLEGITAADRMRALYDLDLRGLPAVPSQHRALLLHRVTSLRPAARAARRPRRPGGPRPRPGRGAPGDRPALRDGARGQGSPQRARLPGAGQVPPRTVGLSRLTAAGGSRRAPAARGRRARDDARRRSAPRRHDVAGARRPASGHVGSPGCAGSGGITTPNDRWPRLIAVIDRIRARLTSAYTLALPTT